MMAIVSLRQDPIGIALVIAFLVICLAIHETAHGWVALKCGDRTAKDLGRLTLNPIPHIDPIMTILLPVFLFVTTGFIFGGARPVPVNFHNLRGGHRDMALVAMAGPGSNFLLACVFYLALKGAVDYGPFEQASRLASVLATIVFFNLILTAFNLLPIPPLDGSRVMAWLLPSGFREGYASLERFGMLLIFVLLLSGVLTGPLFQLIDGMERIVVTIVSLGDRW